MILLYILAAIAVVNCIYYLLFSKFSFSTLNEEGTTKETFSISLLVCAKNEGENLRKNIPHWLAQDYPNFELILINDASNDDTLDVMNSFAQKDPRIEVVDVENNEAFWGNKKYALTLGIKRAKSKRMLFTDADCRPSSDQWIRKMASHFSLKKQIVLGYGGYEKKAGPLNALIRFETLMTAIQYFSYALAGVPYMGVGRNLGYTSSLYYENKGFISHIKIASGDDDLFVNEAATKENTALCVDKNAFTYSYPKTTIREWIFQKRRHISTSKYYKPKHKLLLGIYYLMNFAFWVMVPITLIMSHWQIALVIIGLRVVFQWIVIGKATKKLNENNLIFYIPFLELFLVSMQLTIFISNRLHKPHRWK